MSGAYYNEIDPIAAGWLRWLIDQNLIPAGDVDERSIRDVQPDDLVGYTQCHFFAGIGGWGYALRLAGWPDERPIWTGSCPCQPFSVAGRGAGVDDPRHLWPDFFRLIRAGRPAVVMGEQVAGKAGYGWLDGVLADLAGEGYAGRGVDIPACAVDAPHIRQRLYWIATGGASGVGQADTGLQSRGTGPGDAHDRPVAADAHGERDVADAAGDRGPEISARDGAIGEQRSQERGRAEQSAWTSPSDGGGLRSVRQADVDNLALARSRRLGRGTIEPAGHDGDGSAAGREEGAGGIAGDDEGGVDQVDASGLGRREGRAEHELRCGRPTVAEPDAQGVTQGDAFGQGSQGLGGDVARGSDGWTGADRPGPSPDGRNGTFWSGGDWIVCHDGKARRIPEPGFPLLADGVPARVAKWRGLGNAIVPQLAAEVVSAFLEAEWDWFRGLSYEDQRQHWRAIHGRPPRAGRGL